RRHTRFSRDWSSDVCSSDLIYKSVLERVSPEPVVFRTLDFGGDKFLNGEVFSRELNPFMGLRAIRLCMKNPEVFNAQVRAMLREIGRASCRERGWIGGGAVS